MDVPINLLLHFEQNKRSYITSTISYTYIFIGYYARLQ